MKHKRLLLTVILTLPVLVPCNDAVAIDHTPLDPVTRARLEAGLQGDHRLPRNAVRDRFRHPLSTLEFFGLRRDMTVLEVWPGGG